MNDKLDEIVALKPFPVVEEPFLQLLAFAKPVVLEIVETPMEERVNVTHEVAPRAAGCIAAKDIHEDAEMQDIPQCRVQLFSRFVMRKLRTRDNTHAAREAFHGLFVRVMAQ